MKIINYRRRSGKTMRLIYASEVTGYPIVTPNDQMAKNVKGMAQQLGCSIPEPIAADRPSTIMECKIAKGLLIDEAADLIERALEAYFGVPVVAITMSEPMREGIQLKGVKIVDLNND